MPSLGILARADTHWLFNGISVAFQLSAVQFNSMFLDGTSINGMTTMNMDLVNVLNFQK